jgi:hypothetical protein
MGGLQLQGVRDDSATERRNKVSAAVVGCGLSNGITRLAPRSVLSFSTAESNMYANDATAGQDCHARGVVGSGRRGEEGVDWERRGVEVEEAEAGGEFGENGRPQAAEHEHGRRRRHMSRRRSGSDD